MANTERPGFQAELEQIINRYSMENGSNTPDYILALYLRSCMEAFDRAVATRDNWYGVKLCPGASTFPPPSERVSEPDPFDQDKTGGFC